jgi:hypothetical protein
MSFVRAGLVPRRPRSRRLLVVAVVLLLLTPVGVSLGRAMAYPGSASWQLRLVEWTRDHGGAPLVDTVENWYYTRHRPGAGPPPAGSTPAPVALGAFSAAGRPPEIPPLVSGPLPGEGAWQPLGRLDARGRPYVWASWFRPDPSNSSVTVGVASVDLTRVRAELIAGTRDPGGSWPEGARVPPSQQSRLVAAFNAGFKFADTRGGFATDGRISRPLADGVASAVIDRAGRLTIRRWSGGSVLPSNVAAVRQNLDLIVDAGHPVPGLGLAGSSRWGTSRNQLQYTWRSAIGTTADGRLVYVAGDHTNIAQLATALAHAGATVGMQLDIHAALVTFNAFHPGPRGVAGEKLLASMTRPATRYLTSDQRDFFAVLTG